MTTHTDGLVEAHILVVQAWVMSIIQSYDCSKSEAHRIKSMPNVVYITQMPQSVVAI